MLAPPLQCSSIFLVKLQWEEKEVLFDAHHIRIIYRIIEGSGISEVWIIKGLLYVLWLSMYTHECVTYYMKVVDLQLQQSCCPKKKMHWPPRLGNVYINPVQSVIGHIVVV